MNFKKLKRMLSIVLSASMILSTNMTGFAAPAQADSVAEQEEWQFDTEMEEAADGQDVISRYVSDDDATMYSITTASNETDGGSTSGPTTTEPVEGSTITVDGTSVVDLTAAIAKAKEPGSTINTIILAKDTTLEGEVELTGLTIQTKGYKITIKSKEEVTLNGNNGQIENDVYATEWVTKKDGKPIFVVEEGAKLTINGGTYTTVGAQLLKAAGEVSITNGTFECTAESSKVSNSSTCKYYDGAALFNVEGHLTMTGGSILADIGDGTENGMYGIYAINNGRIDLGQTNGDASPSITSSFAAIGLNATTPTPTINIASGKYKSTVQCTKSEHKKFNSVLYLSANSTVTITGGTFTGNNGDGSVISIPYADKNVAWDEEKEGKPRPTVNLTISGGTFTSSSAGKVFNGLPAEKKDYNGTVLLSGGTYSKPVADITLSSKNYLPAGTELKADGQNVTIGVHEHNYTYVKRQAATCWADGARAHYECSCGALFLAEGDTEEVTEDDIKITKLVHEQVTVRAQNEGNCRKYIPEYYTCVSCGRKYTDRAKFLEGATKPGTQGSDWYAEEKDIPKQTQHNFSPASFTWPASFDEEDFEGFIDGEANGVTATSTCTNPHCKFERPLNVTVTRTKTYMGNDCTQGGSIVYKAKATSKVGTAEEDLSKNPADAGTDGTDTKTVTIAPKENHDYEMTVKWDHFAPKSNANNKLTDYTTGVTVEKKCKLCGQTDNNFDPDITISLADHEKFDPETTILGCGAEIELTFVATVREKGSSKPLAVKNPSCTKKIKGASHKLAEVKGKAASCNAEGNEAYYKCETCQKEFWDATAKDEITKHSDVVIKARGHVFGIKFEFDNPAIGGPVHATVRCVSCGAQVVFRNLTADDKGEYKGMTPKTCGDTAEISYHTGVTFDRMAIVGNEEEGYRYDETKVTNPVLREGYAVRTAVVEHEFEPTLAWKDNAAKYHDITQGLDATLKCSRCQKTVTLTAAKQADGTLSGELRAASPGAPTGTIKVESVTDSASGYKKATCDEDGNDVYKATVIIDTNETDKPGMNTQYTVVKNINNPVEHLEHDYIVNKITWDKDKSVDSNTKLPINLVAEVKCKNCQKSWESSDLGSNITITSVVDKTAASGYKAARCTTPGNDAWKVGVTINTAPVTATAPGTTLFITKPSEKLEHQYNSTPDSWDWSQYGDKDPSNPGRLLLKEDLNEDTANVFAEYVCTNPECDGKRDPDADPKELGKKSGEKWVKQVAVKPVAGNTDATCVKAGIIPYTATLEDKSDDDEQSFYVPVTGHKWQQNVKWTWADTGSKDTDGAPVYTVTASIVCRNKRCSIKKDVNGAEENNTLTVTARTDDDQSAINRTRSYIETTVKHNEATCVKSGSTVYTAKVVFVDEQGMVSLEQGMDTSTRTVLTASKGHKYQTTWEWTGVALEQDGKEKQVTVKTQEEADQAGLIRIESAKATTICANAKDDPDHDPAIIQQFKKEEITPEYVGGSTPTCQQGVIAEYNLQASTASEGSHGRIIINIPQLEHKIQWNINVPLDEINENSKNVLAWKGCPYEMPEDVWTNDDYASDRKNVTLVKAEDTVEPTCTDGGTLVWDLMADGEVLGTVSNDVGPVKGAHKIKVDWDSLKAVKRDADGKVTFDLKGDLTCDFDKQITADGAPSHNAKVELEAVADLGSYDCKNPPQGQVTYQLTIKKIGNQEWTKELAEKNADLIEITGGGYTQKKDFTATGHDTYSVPGKSSYDCSEPSYKAHYRCRLCGKTFTTKSATREVEISLEPQGHQYGDPEFRWTGDGQVEAVFTCTRDNCPAKRTNPKDPATVDPEKSGNIRVFLAEITGGPYPGKEATCETGGTEYYDTSVVLPEGEDAKEYSEAQFDGDIVKDTPIVDHDFSGEGGKCKWCTKTSGTTVKVAFYEGTGSLLETQWYDKSTVSIPSGDLPVAPNRVGYTFGGYAINGNTTRLIQNRNALATNIVTEFGTAGSDGVRVDLVYNPVSTTVSVTTHYIGGTAKNPIPLGKKNDKAEGLELRSHHSVTAPATIVDSNGTTYYFSHWSDAEERTLATSAAYDVYIAEAIDRHIYAVYVAKEEDKKEDVPSVVLTNKYTTTTVDGINKISFTFTMSDLGSYEGCEFLDSGVLYAKKVSYPYNEDMTYEKSSKAVLNGRKTNTLSVKVDQTSDYVAVRGFLRYKKGQEVFIVYSNPVEVTNFASLQ